MPTKHTGEEGKVTHAHKPDAQGFDEIRIYTKPRYKTSGLSGDEWRISGVCQLLRKGKVIHEFSMANVENCAKALSYHIMISGDEGKHFYGGGEDGKCDQEGCADIATVFYRVKNRYCSESYAHGPIPLDERVVVRQFCERHSTRGDCAFDDSDKNYERIEGNIAKPRAEDNSPSAFGGIVNLDPNA